MLIADPFSLRTPIYSDRCFVGSMEPRERYVDCVFLYDREFFKHVAIVHFRTRQQVIGQLLILGEMMELEYTYDLPQ